jgi:hypothetical protein
MQLSRRLHAPAALPPGKWPPVSIGQGRRWAPKSGCCGEVKNLLPLPRIESQLCSPQPIAVVTEPFRLPLMPLKPQIPDDKHAMFAVVRQKLIFRRNLTICIVTDRQKYKNGTCYIREWPEFGTGLWWPKYSTRWTKKQLQVTLPVS